MAEPKRKGEKPARAERARPSGYAPVLRIIASGFRGAFRSRRTLAITFVLAGLLWSYVAVLGTPIRAIVVPSLVALPPISTWFDVAYAMEAGSGIVGVVALASLFLIRALVVTATVGAILEDIEPRPGWPRRGLRVLPIALLIDLFQFSVLLPAQAVLTVPYVGLVIWFAILGGTTTLVYAVIDAWRRDERHTESVFRAVRGIRVRGGAHLPLGLAYVMVSLILTSLWAYAITQPALAIAYGVVATLVNLGFATTFVRRWVAVADEVPPPRSRRS